ncbi:MAG: SpoIID/LytB domain-containing protein [Negativicutes bacterium]|nr:SpoIID/LytB domain-containing protein [Negativicutes bacterium]
MRDKGQIMMVALLIVVLVISGCSLFKTPQKMPGPLKNIQGAEPQISVYMHETGKTESMKMEDYIAGVVAGEMKPEWPVEALAAQAILARTFTLYAMENKGGVPTHGTQASTDIKEFQAYDAKAINDNVRKAVEMTRGMVAVYQGKPIYAWFHASAGGVTATAKEGLNYQQDEPPYTQSVPSPDDLAPADVQNWTATFTKQEVMTALTKLGHSVDSVKGHPVNTVSGVEIGEKGPSGRATTIVVDKDITVPAADFRVAIGSTKLKSMLLDKIDVTGDSVTFTGKGYGHGVGMSQWGANKLATEGKKPEEIVSYYFKGVTIEKRWE